MKFLIGSLIILHGLIVATQSSGNFSTSAPSGIHNPGWVSWWPMNLGRSWLLAWLGLEKAPITWVVGLLWLGAGIALAAAGLGAMGIIIPTEWWRSLAILGAAVSLFMLVVYLHPLMILGTILSLLILIATLWLQWPSPSLIP